MSEEEDEQSARSEMVTYTPGTAPSGWTEARLEIALMQALDFRLECQQDLSEATTVPEKTQALALLGSADAMISNLEGARKRMKDERQARIVSALLALVGIALSFWHEPSAPLVALVALFMTPASALYTRLTFPKEKS